jgi:hypothetical protein
VTLNPPKLSYCDNLTNLTFFSQNALITFKKKKKNPNGVAGHHLGGGLATPAYIYIYFLAFSYFLGFFFCFLRKNVNGAFWE